MNTRERVFGIAYWVAQAIWVSVCVATLVIYIRNRTNATDADVFLGYAMIALSFPSGSIVFAIQARLAGLANIQVGSIGMWAEMLIIGYLQWFVLLPLVIRAIRRRVSARAKGQGAGSS
jgi:hypothetical protein